MPSPCAHARLSPSLLANAKKIMCHILWKGDFGHLLNDIYIQVLYYTLDVEYYSTPTGQTNQPAHPTELHLRSDPRAARPIPARRPRAPSTCPVLPQSDQPSLRAPHMHRCMRILFSSGACHACGLASRIPRTECACMCIRFCASTLN